MKLSDLKNGAVVELRSGQKYLKVDDTFLNLQNYGGFIPIQDYDENLLCTHPSLDEEKNLSIMDIVKVNNDVNSNTLYPNCCNQPAD